VARALARLIVDRREELARRHGLEVKTTLVAGRTGGAWIDPAGIDLEVALRDGWRSPVSAVEALERAPVDLIFEATPLDPQRGEPALSYVRAALERGVSVVSANKGPLAHAAADLLRLARRRQVGYRFESAVADCLPIFNLVEAAIPVGRLIGFRGILNSTSNYALQAVARGGGVAEAVAEMQRRGIAEADPSHDLDGWDQAVKTVVLANVLLGRDLRPADVDRVPVAAVDALWVRSEDRAGRRVRIVASAGVEGPARVGPLALGPDDFLATLSGTSLGISLRTELAGTFNLASVDPGVEQTAYGMLGDLVAIHQGRKLIPSPLFG
jgi:homoserine dehydrogenase